MSDESAIKHACFLFDLEEEQVLELLSAKDSGQTFYGTEEPIYTLDSWSPSWFCSFFNGGKERGQVNYLTHDGARLRKKIVYLKGLLKEAR